MSRHIVVNTPGLLLVVVVSAASAADGTYAPEVLGRLTEDHRSRQELVWADSKDHDHRLGSRMAKEEVGDRIGVVTARPARRGSCRCRGVGWSSGRWRGRGDTGDTAGTTIGMRSRARR